MFLFICTISMFISFSISANEPPTISENELIPEQWRADIDTLVFELESTHPNLYHRGTKNEFKSAIANLQCDLSILNSSSEVIVRLMQALALLEDGHTFIVSYNSFDFDSWFPLRTHNFTDGLFITVIDKE